MTLRLKLIMSFLMVSLITAGTVGASAWWLLQRDFRDSVREQAFQNFSSDIRAYISRFGSWEAAVQSLPFPEFVRQRRPRTAPPPPPEHATFVHPHQPPFRFLLATPDGRVVRGTGEYAEGQTVPESALHEGKAIQIDGETVFYAIPRGTPILTQTDQVYLDFFKRAITIGLAIAAVVAVLLGIVFGSRLVSSLRELTLAIKGMRPEEVPQPVPVRSQDEVGLLAESFNHMSQRLAEAHGKLLKSNETITQQAEELQELSLRDPLTSLYNRRHFDDHAEILRQQAIRHKHPMCIMIADLDHFKSINDRFSHTVGDKVLRQATDILKQNMRKTDLLARFGGEEFVALFVESTLAQARERCEILRKHIEGHDWPAIADGLQVTISIGLCDDLGSGSIGAMLEAADRRLYQAKAAGRNRVEPVG